MSTLSIEVEIVDGKVTPVAPYTLPSSGRGVLTVSTPVVPLKPAEIIEGPDGLLLLRGEGVITFEMVQRAQDLIDLEDAARCQRLGRSPLGES